MRKDNDTLWKLNLMGTWGFDRMESWFTDMSSQGWYLTDFGPFRAFFRRGEPNPRRRYRAALQFDGEISEEEKDIYEGSGWQYVSHWGGINMFCSDDPEAPELFTDDASFRKRSRGFCLNLAGWLVYLIWYNWLWIRNICFDSTESPLHFLAEPYLLPLVLGLTCAAAFCLFMGYQNLRALCLLRRRNYRHDAPYKKTLRAANVLTIALLLMIFLILAALGLENTGLGEKDPLTWKAPHPVTLAEFDPARDADYRAHKDDAVYTQYIEYWGEVDRSPLLFREMLRIRYDASRMETDVITGPGLQSDYSYDAWYYDARSETIAQRFLEEELLENTAKTGITPEDIRIVCKGVDYAGYFQDYDDSQYLYLRKGTRIETVYLKAEGKDLRDSLELFVQDINE